MKDQQETPVWPVDPFPPVPELPSSTAWPVDPFEFSTAAPEPPEVPTEPPPGRAGTRRDDVNELARGGILNLGSTVISAVLNFVLVVVITRGLGTTAAGVFFEAIALFLIVSNTAELGGSSGVLRLIPRFRALHRTQDVRTAVHIGVWPSLVGGVILGWAMFAYAPQLASLFFQSGGATHPRAANLIRVLAVFVPVSGVSTVMVSASRGFGAMLPTVAIENVAKPLFRAAAAIAVVVLGLPVVALGFGWGIPIVIGLVVVIPWSRKLLQRAERHDRYDRRDRRAVGDLASEFWRFSAPRGFVATMHTSQLWLDSLLVGGLVNTSQAAIYTASSRFLAVAIFVIGALNLVIAPMISSLLSMEEHRRAENLYHTATEWIILSSWPPTLIMGTFAPVALGLFGEQYVQGQHVLSILSVGSLFFLSTGPLITVLVMGGKSGWSLFNQVLSLGANIGLNLVLIPRYGISGAALAWALTGVIGQGTALIEVRYFLNLSPYHRTGYLAALGSAVIYGLGGILFRVVLGATLPSLIAYVVVATGVYAVFLWRFRRAFKLGELVRAFRRRGGERAATLQPI